MNYAAEWDAAHGKRLMRADRPDPRLQDFVLNILAGQNEPPGTICILEVGCGTGVNCCWFAEMGLQTFGFDSSPAAIRRAKEFVLEGLTANKYDFAPRLWCSDLTIDGILHLKRFFDAVIDICCLENLDKEEFERALADISRVLKPGGRFFSLTASPERDDALTECGKVRKPEQSELHDQLRAAGFELAKSIDHQTHLDRDNRPVANWMIQARRS